MDISNFGGGNGALSAVKEVNGLSALAISAIGSGLKGVMRIMNL
jgi:hypothetical protein